MFKITSEFVTLLIVIILLVLALFFLFYKVAPVQNCGRFNLMDYQDAGMSAECNFNQNIIMR